MNKAIFANIAHTSLRGISRDYLSIKINTGGNSSIPLTCAQYAQKPARPSITVHLHPEGDHPHILRLFARWLKTCKRHHQMTCTHYEVHGIDLAPTDSSVSTLDAGKGQKNAGNARPENAKVQQ